MGSNVYKNSTIRIKYEQTTPATTWTITHGLGTDSPVVNVYTLQDSEYKMIIPKSVVALSDTVVRVTFTNATAGIAMVM